ncbi:hypothetical protein C1645_819228 [Glomus cerebriforme]|uniref:Uncharacterized protein n=1 Tax=Glomus cerebriforme TaxID=658196 RepID=A0A397TFE3_9GLOM|nr:hypothetical protein C1645_819228 [Glomus cerebriforme]
MSFLHLIQKGKLVVINNFNVPTEITEKLKKILEATSEEIVDITARKLISTTFSNGQIMVICMSKTMAHAWIKLEYFEIDLSFKRVQGDINEFEVNCYNL